MTPDAPLPLPAPPDAQRLRTLASSPWQDALQVTPEQVQASSRSRSWPGLMVWHQMGDARAVYVPPLFGHVVLLKLGRPTRTLQMRAVQAPGRSEPEVERYDGHWPVGSLAVIPAGEACFFRNEHGSDNLHVHIEPELLVRQAATSAAPNSGMLALQRRFVVEDETLRLLCLLLKQALDQPAPNEVRFVEGLAQSLGAHLLAHHTQFVERTSQAPRLHASQLHALLAFIDAHLIERLSVERLAEQVAMSPWHFARCFKQSTGKTPHRHVNERRLARALELLAGTRMAVIEIALEVGFSDPAHFTRNFRSQYGLTPQAYRRAL